MARVRNVVESGGIRQIMRNIKLFQLLLETIRQLRKNPNLQRIAWQTTLQNINKFQLPKGLSQLLKCGEIGRRTIVVILNLPMLTIYHLFLAHTISFIYHTCTLTTAYGQHRQVSRNLKVQPVSNPPLPPKVKDGAKVQFF